jgi:PRTRC genetic system protein C
MARVFVYESNRVPDWDASQTIEQARAKLSQAYPQLVNAEHTISKEGEDEIVTFSRKIGTKGTDELSLEPVPGPLVDAVRGTVDPPPEGELARLQHFVDEFRALTSEQADDRDKVQVLVELDGPRVLAVYANQRAVVVQVYDRQTPESAMETLPDAVMRAAARGRAEWVVDRKAYPFEVYRAPDAE